MFFSFFRKRSPIKRVTYRRKLFIEVLEDRLAPAVIAVSPGAETLRAAIAVVDGNADAQNTLQLSAGQYTLTDESAGSLVIQNTNPSVPAKTLNIVGAGPDATVVEPDAPGWHDRIFSIIGNDTTVTLQSLEISGGLATDGGVLGAGSALGGGVLIVWANVTLDNVHLFANQAVGLDGTAGLNGVPGSPDGSKGTDGGEADGGGIYMASG